MRNKPEDPAFGLGHVSDLRDGRSAAMLSGIIGPEAVVRRILEKISVATLAEDRCAPVVSRGNPIAHSLVGGS